VCKELCGHCVKGYVKVWVSVISHSAGVARSHDTVCEGNVLQGHAIDLHGGKGIGMSGALNSGGNPILWYVSLGKCVSGYREVGIHGQFIVR